LPELELSAELAPGLPIVLVIDDAVELEPFAEAFAGELRCRREVSGAEHRRVVALVTGGEPVGSEQVAPFEELRVVLTCSIGTDHLDLDALADRALIVCHALDYCVSEVADHALACVLAGWRGLWTLGARVRAGQWNAPSLLRRSDTQRLGVIGLGRIGSELARRAIALGIEVVGADPYAAGPAGVQPLELEALLTTSDAISVHVPGTPGGPPLLGAREVAMIKPGAVLVNLARASVVDLDAVLAALSSGALSGAAWDVWPSEPPAEDDQRLLTPGLLVTPHVAWSSPQALEAYRAEAIDGLRATLIDGVQPAGLVC
jgi:D-3-phosphoglycerate dehydrogenase